MTAVDIASSSFIISLLLISFFLMIKKEKRSSVVSSSINLKKVIEILSENGVETLKISKWDEIDIFGMTTYRIKAFVSDTLKNTEQKAIETQVASITRDFDSDSEVAEQIISKIRSNL